jgi:hypothetical protein
VGLDVYDFFFWLDSSFPQRAFCAAEILARASDIRRRRRRSSSSPAPEPLGRSNPVTKESAVTHSAWYGLKATRSRCARARSNELVAVRREELVLALRPGPPLQFVRTLVYLNVDGVRVGTRFDACCGLDRGTSPAKPV